MPSYEVDEQGQVHECDDEIECSKCGSKNTELGPDYVFCHDCKHEHVF